MSPEPRSRAERRRDTEHRLAHDVDVEAIEMGALARERGDRFAARTGFDPRILATAYRWFRVTPRRIQAWREVDELPDRELMRDGRWTA